MSQYKNLFVAKIQSNVIAYPTRLIPSHRETRWNGNNSYTWESKQCNTRSPRQVAILVPFLEIPPATHQPRTSWVPISTSMVNDLPRLHKFLSPTFACIWSKVFLSSSLYPTNQAIVSPVQVEPSTKSLWRAIKVSCSTTIPHQGDVLENLTAIILVGQLHHKSRYSKLYFHFAIIITSTYLCIYIYIYKIFYKTFMFKSICVIIFLFKNSWIKIYIYVQIYKGKCCIKHLI